MCSLLGRGGFGQRASVTSIVAYAREMHGDLRRFRAERHRSRRLDRPASVAIGAFRHTRLALDGAERRSSRTLTAVSMARSERRASRYPSSTGYDNSGTSSRTKEGQAVGREVADVADFEMNALVGADQRASAAIHSEFRSENSRAALRASAERHAASSFAIRSE
jgi:hypothetical protein